MYTTAQHQTQARPLTAPAPQTGAMNPWLIWRVESPGESQTLSIAELAECRCPDLCDRDHANE